MIILGNEPACRQAGYESVTNVTNKTIRKDPLLRKQVKKVLLALLRSQVKGLLPLTVLLFLSAYSFSATVRVRIYTSSKISSFSFTPSSGWYAAHGDLIKKFDFKAPQQITLKVVEDSMIAMKLGDSLIGKFAFVHFWENVTDSVRKGALKIKIPGQEKYPREYEDGLMVTAEKGLLKIVNEIDVERYTAGVIKSEVGIAQPLESYKVKAISIRTYNLSPPREHEQEHFHLSAHLHRHAYRRETTVANIPKAVKETAGLVLADTA